MVVRGAAFGGKGLDHFAQGRAQPGEQGPGHHVARHEDALFLDLRRQVPVADMPGDLRQMLAAPAAVISSSGSGAATISTTRPSSSSSPPKCSSVTVLGEIDE